MAAAAQKALLLWGYDAPAKDTTPLDQFIEFITNPTINPPKAGEMKNVLIYWDRGTLARGDEAKMVEIGIDSDLYCAHVLDIQEWFQVRYPKCASGTDKHSLGEAAEMMHIDTVRQRELDDLTESEREYNLAAMAHCAGGDSEITLRIFIAVVLLRIKELNALAGDGDDTDGMRAFRDDFCFIGIDFEGGGDIGQGTTEIGLSLVFSSQIDVSAGNAGLGLQNRHAVIWEMFDDHISRGAQNGRMAIDDQESKTYPRWNFRGEPNSTRRLRYCFPDSRRRDWHEDLSISVDTELVYMEHMAWWIVHQFPGSAPLDTGTPANPTHSLNEVGTCMYHKHYTRARDRGADGRLVYPIIQTRSQAWDAQECRM